MQFDAYRNKLKHTWRSRGNGNLVQRIAIAIGKRQFARAAVFA